MKVPRKEFLLLTSLALTACSQENTPSTAENTLAQSSAVIDSAPSASDDIGGVVTSGNGPEAGVWVIAETKDLATPFAKIVVTDDNGSR